MIKTRLIDFFVVGPPKCGTTSLYNIMKSNPAIFVPHKKEPHYFQFKNDNTEYRGPGDNLTINEMIVKDEADFFNLYQGASVSQKCGDFSTMFFYNKRAMENIKKHNPNARIIIVLRNPIDRAFSNFMHLIRDGRETEKNPLKAFLFSEERINASNYMPFWNYSSPGKYSHWVPMWQMNFTDVLLIDFRRLKLDLPQVLADISNFLSISNEFVYDSDRRNVSGIPKCTLLHKVLKEKTIFHRITKLLIPDDRVRNRIKNGITNLNLNSGSKKNYINDEYIEYLTKYYSKDLAFMDKIFEK